MLAVFDITKAIGEDGQVIEPTYEYSDGLAAWVHLHIFQAEIF